MQRRCEWCLVWDCPVICVKKLHANPYNLVSTVTTLRVGRSDVNLPAEERKFFFSLKSPETIWSPPSLLFNGYRCYFTGSKQPGCRNRKSLPLSAKVKIEGSSICTPHLHLQGVNTHSWTFSTIYQEVILASCGTLSSISNLSRNDSAWSVSFSKMLSKNLKCITVSTSDVSEYQTSLLKKKNCSLIAMAIIQ
jgi:hypothetical protein